MHPRLISSTKWPARQRLRKGSLGNHSKTEEEVADYDVIVLGAGHAGMMTATYLARAGLDVVILEKDLEVGGDMCTESFAYPGYWHNLHSYYHLGVDRLPPFRDLGFERFHADYVTPDPQNALLLEDGRTLFGWLNPEKTADSIAVVSAKDGDTVRDVNRRLGRFPSGAGDSRSVRRVPERRKRLRPGGRAWRFAGGPGSRRIPRADGAGRRRAAL